MIPLGHVFETLAEGTWSRMRLGWDYHCHLGEETITDLNLLELKRTAGGRIHIKKVGKHQESQYGIDWEWWIGSARLGWWRYAVQAKKLSYENHYGSIRHKVGNPPRTQQIHLLKNFANRNNALPIYCMYNHSPLQDKALWHCTLSPDWPQLGCTIVPVDVVEDTIRRHHTIRFEDLHRYPTVLPWRCLFRCIHGPQALSGTSLWNHPLPLNGSVAPDPFGVYNGLRFPELPQFVQFPPQNVPVSQFPPGTGQNVPVGWFATLPSYVDGNSGVIPLEDLTYDFYNDNSRGPDGERILPSWVVVLDLANITGQDLDYDSSNPREPLRLF